MAHITDVTILHGYGVKPESMWFPWLHQELEERLLAVRTPALPRPLRPDYAAWVRAAAPIARAWTPRSLVVAHSLGAVLALRLLEREAVSRVAGVVLVSPPFTATVNVDPLVRFYSRPIDWQRLRDMSKSFIVLQAKDDPLVPFDHCFRYAEALGADVRLAAKGGHFVGKTCPKVLRIITPMLK